MNKLFARRLIEQPDEQTTQQLFADRIDGIFWVDWREADDDIVAYAGAAMGGDALVPEWIDGKLHIRYRGALTLVPLAFQPGEQDITLLALNRAIAPEFEIRCVKASDGGDTLAFMVLDRATWAELEFTFGARVNAAFARIEAGSPFFAPVTKPAAPAPDAAAIRYAEVGERLQEGFRLAKEKKHDEAIAIYEEIDRRFGQEPNVGIRLRVVSALVAKGDELAALNKHVEAVAAYEAVYMRFGRDANESVRDLVAVGLFQQGRSWASLGKFEDEIASIDQLCARYGDERAPRIRQTVISAMRNKVNALGRLDRPQERLAAYDDIVRRFESDTTPDIRADVGLALNGAGYGRMMQAKREWADAKSRTALLRRAITELRGALERCEEKWKVMVLGNIGYALFLAGDELNAARETQECLRLGGADALNGQRSDAAAHRLAVEDAAYEDMLKRLWGKLHPAGN